MSAERGAEVRFFFCSREPVFGDSTYAYRGYLPSFSVPLPRRSHSWASMLCPGLSSIENVIKTLPAVKVPRTQGRR